METTSVNIKLTPFVKKNINDTTTCCLEIVPEVSKAHLHKSIMREKNEIMEYIIPMTYKILLKKYPSSIVDKEKNDKVYHSCVDLLTTSSMTDLNVGYKEISKIPSDYYIFDETTTPLTNDYVIEVQPQNIKKQSQEYNNESKNVILKTESSLAFKSKSTNCLPKIDKSCETIASTTTNMDSKVKYPLVKPSLLQNDKVRKSYLSELNEKVVSDKYKFKSEENKNDFVLPKYSEMYVSPVETHSDMNNKIEYLSNKLIKLSFTPICTVNTIDTLLHPVSYMGDASYFSNDADNEMFKTKANNTAMNRKKSSKKQVCVVRKKDSYDSFKTIKSGFDKYESRIIPEVRVAKFVQDMEREFLPLRLMLDEIKQKCQVLDPSMFMNNLVTSNEFLPSRTFCFNDIIKFNTYKEDLPKSNRVVYSIVYDD